LTITQEQVNESLDNAVVNGYDLDAEFAYDIALDLGTYDSTFEGMEVEELLPFVDAWKEARRQ